VAFLPVEGVSRKLSNHPTEEMKTQVIVFGLERYAVREQGGHYVADNEEVIAIECVALTKGSGALV
jgi:hypothetical protein